MTCVGMFATVNTRIVVKVLYKVSIEKDTIYKLTGFKDPSIS